MTKTVLFAWVCLIEYIAATAGSPSMTQTVTNALTSGIDDFIRRHPPGVSLATPMYARKTQAPIVWIHLKKAPRIVVDNEFYNLSTIAGMNATGNFTAILVPDKKKYVLPDIQHLMSPTSFTQTKVDPLLIQNGLYLSMPLRNPPQETVNVVAAEDTRSIAGIADMVRKKREIKRLEKAFNLIISQVAG